MPKNQLTQELEKEFTKGNLKPTQIKKSKSAEELKPKFSPEVQALTAQLNATQEKLNSLQTRLGNHEPSLL